jgi:cobalt/nickel transport system permease protein
MTAVIGLQGLLFQDGGLLVMGWNIINMGVLTAFAGALVYRLITGWLGQGRRTLMVGGFLGAWMSVEIGAIATAMELAASGTSPLGLALPAMVAVHALIGLGEGIITIGALLLIYRTRPDLLHLGGTAPGQTSAGWVTAGLLLSLIVAIFSFAASGSPDGLERVAEDQGFLSTALDPVYQLFPDYTTPFIGNELISGIVAMVLGTSLVFAILFLVGRLIRRPNTDGN